MSENFPISDSVVAVLQSASLSLSQRCTDAVNHSCFEQYSMEHSLMMRCVANLPSLWLAIGCTSPEEEPNGAPSYTRPSTNACLHPARCSPSAAAADSIGRADHIRDMQDLVYQIESFKARIQELEGQLADAAVLLSQTYLDSAVVGDTKIQMSSLPDVKPAARVSGGGGFNPTVLNCSAAISAGLNRRNPNFLRRIFDRHKNGTGGLLPSQLIVALTEADAPIIPDFEAAASAAINQYGCDSDGLMSFGEFERAIDSPDELALYFREKRQPAFADALRALVGRGSDQLLRVSQLSPDDVHAASIAICISFPAQARSLHAELQCSFAVQFEIQAQMEADAGKFNVVKMACGGIVDFHSGLTGRVGMPHLKFKDAMRQEHCDRAGCNTTFTTGNYKITTTPKQEWLYIAGDEAGNHISCPDMGHGRRIVPISELMNLQLAIHAKLTEVEMMAIVLYTGPMFQASLRVRVRSCAFVVIVLQVYNCILRRFPADKYALFEEGGNRYSTTIFVLVSAVQKVSRCTRIPEGTLLYRGLGGLIDLPDAFHEADEKGRSGYLDWGMMSTSSDRNVALGYSGVKQRKPKAMVMVIEATSVDRGADISDFSQYPGEKEFLWLPCSFVQRAQPGGGRVEVIDGGLVSFVPVRVNLNLKTETVEELLEKKKSMHVAGFEFRASELRLTLQDIAAAGNAEARLQRDLKSAEGYAWASRKVFSVEGYIEAQLKKVATVLNRHRTRHAADYCDDAVFRRLVAESLEVVAMAQSALVWWLEDTEQRIHGIEDQSLLYCHRRLQSFLRLRFTCADNQTSRHVAALALCRARNLLCSDDANERDDNDETCLLALCAGGGSPSDVKLIISAGADVALSNASDSCAMTLAAQQGNADAINVLLSTGADCNRADKKGFTPLMACCWTGHLDCVEALLRGRADVNQARSDGGTPLFIACQQDHPHVLETLLKSGADINKSKTQGETPLFIACQLGHTRIVSMLIRAGADVNKAKLDGATPASVAAEKGHTTIVQALAQEGAQLEYKSKMRRVDCS